MSTLPPVARGHEIKVLDKGYVRLIDFMGSDEGVIEAARMSTDKGFLGWDPSPGNPGGDAALLGFLYRHRHMTPFELGGEMVIEVYAPIVVWREWHRHRTFSFNEMSGRYGVLPNDYYVPAPGRVQRQSTTNKQGSGGGFGEGVADLYAAGFAAEQRRSRESYEGRLEDGMARELARLNLPVSQYSRCRVKANLRNWLAFLTLRHHPAAQWEIQQYAAASGALLRAIWPRTYALWEDHEKNGVRFSGSEMAALRELLLDLGNDEFDREASYYGERAGLTGRLLGEFLAKLKEVSGG